MTARCRGARSGGDSAEPSSNLNPDFHQVDTLLQAANQTLRTAMHASSVVTRPSDVKALVDVAAHALKSGDVASCLSSNEKTKTDIPGRAATN